MNIEIPKPKRKRRANPRRDLLVLTWDKKTGHLFHVSQCHTEVGAGVSARYAQSFDPESRRHEVQIVDAGMLRALGSAVTRDTELAELNKLFLQVAPE